MRPSAEHLLRVAEEAARAAGSSLRRFRSKPIQAELKTGRDIVTEADLAAEAAILQAVRHHFPTHSLFSEEAGFQRGSAPYCWVIDPLDGTINYAAGLPLYAVSVAVLRDGLPLAGVVYQPENRTLFRAVRGGGAYAGEERLRAAGTARLDDALIAYSLTSHYSVGDTATAIRLLRELVLRTRGTRVFVCGALELVLLASSRLDATISGKADPFSYAAGALILGEAGGTITDFSGRPFRHGSNTLLAAGHRQLHRALLPIVRPWSGSGSRAARGSRRERGARGRHR